MNRKKLFDTKSFVDEKLSEIHSVVDSDEFCLMRKSEQTEIRDEFQKWDSISAMLGEKIRHCKQPHTRDSVMQKYSIVLDMLADVIQKYEDVEYGDAGYVDFLEWMSIYNDIDSMRGC